MKYSKNDIKRFWSKVNIKDPDECWNWKASLRNGYGQFYMDLGQMRSHRVAWEITNGDIPTDKLCLHKCDNPICCNPNHLYIGTQFNNMEDKVFRCRKSNISPEEYTRRASISAKLHDYEIKEIRELVSRGYMKTRIAKMFKIGRRTIYEVLLPSHICKEGYYV